MKTKTFSGGYRFRGFEGQPQDKLISLDIPPRVIIPLSQGFGSPVEPQVRIGQNLQAGQIIGSSQDRVSSPVHSSINGKVVDIAKRNYFKREINMVTIEDSGQQGDFKRIDGYSAQWERLPSQQIEELLYKSGVTSLDREGIPTRFKTSIIKPFDVENLIIHAAGSEVYNLRLKTLLKGKNLFNLIEGIKILRKIMPKANVHLVLNREKKDVIEKIRKLTSNLERFKIYPVVPKYPQGYDEVLIPTVLGKKFPYGYSAANIGIVVLNTQAVLSVWDAVAEGKPLIERTIALCGPSFKENLHIKVRVGTPLEYILKDRLRDVPSRIVLNSLLTGVELNDYSLPIDRTFSEIIAIPEDKMRKFLAFLRPGFCIDSYSNSFFSCITGSRKTIDTNCHGEERPCIQCGYCMDVCPVGINPTLIDRYKRLGIDKTLMNYGIFNCIECNLCSYVCPSKITLGRNLRDAKAKLIESGCDHSLCILPRFNLKGLEEYKGIKTVR